MVTAASVAHTLSRLEPGKVVSNSEPTHWIPEPTDLEWGCSCKRTRLRVSYGEKNHFATNLRDAAESATKRIEQFLERRQEFPEEPHLLVRIGPHYSCSIGLLFVRWLARICSVVNTPPQTLQRQPGDAACAITDTDC
jgi:hypothetical protein